jgi:hypothetical protein
LRIVINDFQLRENDRHLAISTSCMRWPIQPSTTIGAQANVDTAKSFAQNNPSGLEKLATSAVNVPASSAVRLIAQNASLQHKTIESSAVDAMPPTPVG